MSLKYKVKSLDGIDKNLHGFYEEKDGEFVLKVEGLDDGAELKRAKDHEKRARQDAERKLAEVLPQLEALTEERDGLLKGTIPKGDVDRLEASWKDKLAKREAALTGELDGLKGSLNTLLVDSVATKLASELAVPGSADLLIPHIKSRLGAEQREGNYTTVVRDKDGKPSALTVDELKNEFVTNPAFAPVIVASKASGGGASQSNGGGAAKTVKRSDFASMNPAQQMAHTKAGGTVTD